MTTVQKKSHTPPLDHERMYKTLARLERSFDSIIESDCFGMIPSPNTLALHNQLKEGIAAAKEIIHKDSTHGSKKKSKKKSKKIFKSKVELKGGNTYNWKVGDCVRPIGMPTYYTISRNYDKDNWIMSAPSGGGHVITDIIPKGVENSGTWEKVDCSGSKKKITKSKSKMKSKRKPKRKSKSRRRR